MQTTIRFQVASFGDVLLNEKQRKPIVTLNNEFTIIHRFLTTASLARVDKALNRPDTNWFDTSSI